MCSALRSPPVHLWPCCHHSTPFSPPLSALPSLPLLFLLALSPAAVSPQPPVSPAACPQACFCNAPSRIVYCSRRGLPRIPPGIPPDSLQLNLNGNAFISPVLSPANFTGLDALEHLYMSECGLERIELETFLGLVSLKWLDLSNNRIRAISEFGFRGLTLQHLFLNGNRHIRLVAESFEGLVTTGLYLHDCSLARITPDVLAPLNATLKYLWLNGNELDKFDRRLSGLFSRLSHLRLGSNPLHCNCEVIWLKELFDSNEDIFKGAVSPSCLTPHRLKGRYFNELALADFRCQAPMFNNIETTFGTHSGRLKCSATGDPAPTLYWIQPSGRTTKYSPPAEEDARANEGVLGLTAGVDDRALVEEDAATAKDGAMKDSSNFFGMYICIANNDAGNVTLTINVSWPLVRLSESASVASVSPPGRANQSQRIHFNIPPSSSSVSERSTAARSTTTITFSANQSPVELLQSDSASRLASARSPADPGSERTNYTILDPVDFVSGSEKEEEPEAGRLLPRMFTLTEFVCAVLGAHILTLLVCVVVVPIVYRARWRKRLLEKQRQQQLHHQLHYDERRAPQQQLLLNRPAAAAAAPSAEGTPSRSRLLQHQQSDWDRPESTYSNVGSLRGRPLPPQPPPPRPLYLTDYLVTSAK